MPDPTWFANARRILQQAVRNALTALALGTYFPNLDLTIQIRDGKIVRTDWREMDTNQN